MRYLPVTVLLLAVTGCTQSSDGASKASSSAPSATPTTSTSDQPGAPWCPSALAMDTTALQATPSGLRTQDVVVGNGAEATAGHQVTVHYTGWLTSGQKFDSSCDRKEPFTFGLGAGQVIQGWDEGVAGMKVGGRRKLVIPATLGYGAAGAPPDIPPNATLVFDVELVAVQ